jgi:2-amino-4-hydroxy-6-hydroxymethyldihydropteridine diphosphokinase
LSEATPTDHKKNKVYLALGSNIDPEKYLPLAIKKLGELVDVLATSSAWQTPSVGFAGDDFLNAVVLIETSLPPDDLKENVLRKIESQLNRVRTEEKFAPRTIDIDILIYNDELIDEELWAQPHLAVPLAELYPTFGKNTGEKLEDIARALQQTSSISLREKVLKAIN